MMSIRTNHPHICTLYDVGREGDTDFLVMEHLEGEAQSQRLTKGVQPFPSSPRRTMARSLHRCVVRLGYCAALVPLILGMGCGESENPPSAQVVPPDSAFEFALLGDNPYPPANVPRFENLIRDVNDVTDLTWVVHVGDILGPNIVGCSDEVLRARFALYQGFAFPFVFTPGDNDWFDCRGPDAGGYDPYERLNFLRTLFFASPGVTTGGGQMEVQTQRSEPEFEKFVENAMWTREGVVFSTFHLIGLPRSEDPVGVERRMDAALSWIAKTFELAKASGSVGVFMATQADPWVVSGLQGLVRRMCADCFDPRPGLERLYPALERETMAFDGPVVLAVGDTHVFRVDKPLYSADTGLLIENFTRVEPFGHPYVHWVRVRVDPLSDEVFSFQQQIVEDNVGAAAEL